MIVHDIVEYVTAAKAGIEALKVAKSMLPAGKEADKVQSEIDKAEGAVDQAKAEAAKKLGFQLCRCEFPPPIMLWDKDQRKSVCPKCGDIYPPPQKPVGELSLKGASWGRARRGG